MLLIVDAQMSFFPFFFYVKIQSFLKYALGRGGATIRGLEERSGARIKASY